MMRISVLLLLLLYFAPTHCGAYVDGVDPDPQKIQNQMENFDVKWMMVSLPALSAGYIIVAYARDLHSTNWATDHFSNAMGSFFITSGLLMFARMDSKARRCLHATVFCLVTAANIVGEFMPPTSGFDCKDLLAGIVGSGMFILLDRSHERWLRRGRGLDSRAGN